MRRPSITVSRLQLTVFNKKLTAITDPEVYGPDANEFNPGRWFSKNPDTSIPAPFHFSFGAGGRSCTAINFSNRILYSIFFRLILSYNITESKKLPPVIHHIDYNKDTTAQSAIPKDFKARFRVRDQASFDKCMESSAENTSCVTNGMTKC